MKSNRGARPKIVVIDDEPDFLVLIESWLKPSYDVTAFAHSFGLVEQLQSLKPDLVLLDVHMPEESGFRICRRLRSTPGLSDLPVIFLTGSITDEDFLLHIETGGTRYLTKPIGRRKLLDAVSEHLGT
jgi:CheY-like chemotaxis protein